MLRPLDTGLGEAEVAPMLLGNKLVRTRLRLFLADPEDMIRPGFFSEEAASCVKDALMISKYEL